VDASVGDATLLLYSGGVGAIQPDGFNEFSASSIAEALANGTNIATIKDTQIRIFLDSDEFSAALDSAIVADIAAHGTSSSYYNRTVDQVMLGQDANGVRVCLRWSTKVVEGSNTMKSAS
jgi:hypothetical protein